MTKQGEKYDEGKPMVGLMFRDFSNALTAVAEVSTYGCIKYGKPSGWKDVPDNRNRYEDALGRHLLANATSGVDEESGLLHLAHLAWNALAILEIELTKSEVAEDPASINDDECCGSCKHFINEDAKGRGTCLAVDMVTLCDGWCADWEKTKGNAK